MTYRTREETRPERVPDAARRADVAILGGGVLGVCTALYLQEAGTQVTLLERADLAAGASYGNAGWIFPSHATPLPGPGVTRQALGWLLNPESPLYIKPTLRPDMLRFLWRFFRVCDRASAERGFSLNRELSLASRACYEALAARPEFDFGYRGNGLVLAFEGREGLREIEEDLRLLEGWGGEAKRLDAAGLREIEPHLSPDLAGGVFFPADASIEPAPFVHQTGHAAEQAGAHLCTHTEVLEIRPVRDGVHLETNRGSFRAKQLVLAAGAWTPPLVRHLGVSLPIEAAKGYTVSVQKPETFGDVPIMLAESKVGVSPMGAMLRFAGTLELAGLDLRVNSRRVSAIRKAVDRCLPGVGEAPHLETWRGLRPLSPDGLPILGRLTRHPQIIVAGGHGMIGMAQGPISGRLVAELARGVTPSMDLSPFSGSRFGL